MTNTKKSPAAFFADRAQETMAEVQALEKALDENPSLPRIIRSSARTYASEQMCKARMYGDMAMQFGMK